MVLKIVIITSNVLLRWDNANPLRIPIDVWLRRTVVARNLKQRCRPTLIVVWFAENLLSMPTVSKLY